MAGVLNEVETRKRDGTSKAVPRIFQMEAHMLELLYIAQFDFIARPYESQELPVADDIVAAGAMVAADPAVNARRKDMSVTESPIACAEDH